MKRRVVSEWPKTIAVGGTKVRVYRRRRANGSYGFEVADYTSGFRRLRSFADPGKAMAEAERIARLLAAGEAHAAQVSGKDVASFGRAIELIRPTGAPLELAASTYAEAVKILGGDRILEACRYFADRDPTRLPPKTVAEAAAELVAMKQARGKSDRYVQDLRARLARLAEAFATQVSSVTTADVQRWLDGMKAAPQTLVNFRRVAFTLFEFCEARGYILKGSNPVADTERIEGTNAGAIAIYSPQEIARLLASASPDFIPALSVAAFAGLRSAEVERLEWSDVDLAGGFITVTAAKAKTASRRVIPISPNLAAWLAPHARKTGNLWPGTHRAFYAAQQSAAEAAGVPWKPNACRHSFASYRLAQTQDAAKVALECGNSPAMVFRHYRELTEPDAAAAWFAVRPEAPENVLSITTAANA